MTKSETKSLLSYLNANPTEWHSLLGTSVMHKCGEVGKLLSVDHRNGKPYLYFQFRNGPFANPEPCFLPESFGNGTLSFVSLPDTLTHVFQRSAHRAQDEEAAQNARERISIIRSNKAISFPLPRRLQDFVAKEVGWNYSPKRNDYGLTDDVPIADYMGTYFPRSFVEAYFLMHLLLHKRVIARTFLDRSAISIADIGSGTGANMLGVLWAVRDHCLVSGFDFPRVVVTSVDKSGEAMEIQSKLIQAFFPDCVNVKPELLDYHSGTEFLKNVKTRIYSNGPFDVIMCWKFICEFYRSEADYVQNRGMYAEVLRLGDKHLENEGILAICDVTNPPYPNHQRFLPCIANCETHELLKKQETDLVPILPVSCAHWYGCCGGYFTCFIQKSFKVSHDALPCGQAHDGQGVFLKVFARKVFASVILKDENPAEGYFVGANAKGWLTTCSVGRKGLIPPEQSELTGRSLVDAFRWASGRNNL
jgi:hypothetical protein